MCPGAANAPPPLQSLPFTQLSCLFSFTLTSPSSSPPLFFVFHFRPPPLSRSSLFFPARRCFSFLRFSFLRFRTPSPSLFHSLLLSFPSLSRHLACLFSLFFLIPLQITSRAAAPVRQYRQMRTFLLIISLIQSTPTKRRISNNYSWNDIKGWAWLFFLFFLSHI